MNYQDDMVFDVLYPHQKNAVKNLRDGKILYGGVGSGKTLTALAYYKTNHSDKPLLVITTAKKRETGEWFEDGLKIGVTDFTVDSWNNIKKYQEVENQFILFDEHKLSSYGTWSKTFIKMSKKNPWLLLTATPGDTWMDYIPVFIANGLYKNKTQFERRHVVYRRNTTFPMIERFMEEPLLERIRKDLLVVMPDIRDTTRERCFIKTGYDETAYKRTIDTRVDPFIDAPLENRTQFMHCIRKIVNGSKQRTEELKKLIKNINRIIIFYNYNYERNIILSACEEIGVRYAEYSGHKHEELPVGDKWVYVVQYTSGAEGWNCTTTDTIIFYSLNYSYKTLEQAEGRIDRINTPFKRLFYIYFVSDSSIDKGILSAIYSKKKFNEKVWEMEVSNHYRGKFSERVYKNTEKRTTRSHRYKK